MALPAKRAVRESQSSCFFGSYVRKATRAIEHQSGQAAANQALLIDGLAAIQCGDGEVETKSEANLEGQFGGGCLRQRAGVEERGAEGGRRHGDDRVVKSKTAEHPILNDSAASERCDAGLAVHPAHVAAQLHRVPLQAPGPQRPRQPARVPAGHQALAHVVQKKMFVVAY